MHQHAPLAYFVGVASGVYQAIFPVYLIAEEPALHQFVVALDEYQATVPAPTVEDDPARRRYANRLLRLRLHQPLFRAQVLRAYQTRCAMCGLAYASLLDAAHILPDNHPRGEPVLPNGLALCKLHHAAYDSNILGVRPDLLIETRHDVLRADGGAMLHHSLQALHGTRLLVPRHVSDRPDSERLAERYTQFRSGDVLQRASM
jgi:putative restriction endonuclease